ncbi:aldehyde dehydrogenase family protein [Streptomyces sp. NPDC058052]|uniref:aldehyde dehydrogenase family protein n=1 Tax=Streptomyces sp. NPDC058052 TaxID=3346316 RepID=UPI0036EF13FB
MGRRRLRDQAAESRVPAGRRRVDHRPLRAAHRRKRPVGHTFGPRGGAQPAGRLPPLTGSRRQGLRPGTPPQPVRPASAQRLHRTRVVPARYDGRRAADGRGAGAAHAEGDRRCRSRPRRGQHLLDRAARHALRAVRPQPCRPAQAEPAHGSAAAGPEQGVRRLHRVGLLRIVTGGVDVGSAAVAHRGVSHVHITGSVTSHDVIVFGPGEEGRARQARGEVLLDKPITSELGGVSPTIVIPGKWSKRDLAYQAEHIATQKLHNNGYNCIASQVLVVSSDWEQKDDFLTALREAFTRTITRPAYYPGSDERCSAAVKDHPGTARPVGAGTRVLLEEIPAEGDIAFTEEYFAPVLAVTSLPGQGRDFLARATAFANERLSGTLGANVVAHPRTIRRLGDDFTRFVADLRYGTVAVNAWTGVGYLTARATWGAFPGHTLQDAQSGIGIVHNGLLLDGTERTIVSGPFRPFPRSVLTGQLTLSPRPPWFVTNRTAAVTGRLLTAFAGRPGWSKLPGILASALRG